MRHYLTIDQNRLSSKPTGKQVGIIKSRFEEAEADSVRDFIDVVQQGISWSGATFENDHLANKNFIQQSIFGLDFDGEGDLTPQDAFDRLKKYDITPNCWYPSFSDDPDGKRKFRLVFFFDQAITNADDHKALMNLLMKFYPEADASASDRARFFYGSQTPGKAVNEDEINLRDFYTVLSSDAISGARMHKNGRKTKKGKSLHKSISYYNTNSKYVNAAIQKKQYERLIENKKKKVGWEKLAKRVEVFDQFMNGSERLKYSQLEGIATNLTWMKGGAKLYKQRLQEFNENHEGNNPYPKDGRFELCRDFRERNQQFESCMFPMNLDNEKFKAPEADKQYKNLIEAERDYVRGVRFDPVNRMPLQKAEQLFLHKFRQVKDFMDTDIHIFKTHTALGKTEQIKNAGPNTLSCFPTHNLKEEVYERRRDKHNAVMTPKLPKFKSMELNNRIANLYELGFSGKAHKLLVSVMLSTTTDDWCMEDQRRAEEYITKKKELFVTNKAIMTTHEWGLFNADKLSQIDTVVFDEDPYETLCPVDSVKVSDLTKMASKSGEGMFKWNENLTLLDLVKYLVEEVDEGEVTELPSIFDLNLEDRATSYSLVEDISSNIVQFLESDFIYKEKGNPDQIHFINQFYLPEDKQVIILAADARVNLYHELYGSRVKVHDISDIEQKGKVQQNLSKSYSRVSLKNSLEEIKELEDGSPVITFMTMKQHFQNADEQCHFSNTSGYDHLKGKDIQIYGTPYPHNSKILLLGAVLGIPIRHENNREFGRKNVEYNGMKFTFNCFLNNDRLNKILFDDIHGNLLQAAGRARTLREDCTATVYSNFPLRIAAPNFNY